MRILIVSKAYVVGIYQRKLEELARLPEVDLTLIVPPSWRDPSGETPLERVYTTGYRMLVEPIRFNGNFHLYYFPTLGRRLPELCPDIVHIDEEPYNVAAWHTLWHARRMGAKSLFFSWQNIRRSYPFPFSSGTRWALGHVDYAIAGTPSAADVWHACGYRGPMAVIPQFGIDPEFFAPRLAADQPADPFRIGFAGRLVPEKGVDLLIRAAATLTGAWTLQIAGQGPQHGALLALAETLGVRDRVCFLGRLPSTDLPDFYRGLDALVIPSLTLPNWKEQFGRVIIEAMACGVPVIGSDSGAIPDLIGQAGLIFPEDNLRQLAAQLQTLRADPALRRTMAQAGRRHVLEQYTHAQIAAQTYAVYKTMLSTAG